MILTAVVKSESGETLGVLVLQEREFKTRSKGLYGLGKITINGARYQASTMLVEIGSKGAAPVTSEGVHE